MPQYRNIPSDAKCYSEVAAIGSRTLCVTVAELVACGISDVYLWRALSCHRTGEAYCWPHHKEGNTVYIHYDGLKPKYQTLINSVHCGGMDAHQFTTNSDAQRRQHELQRVCSSLPTMVEIYPEDIQELSKSGLFEGVDTQRIARAAAYLRLWRKLDVKSARKMGFSSVTELQTALFELCMNEQSKSFVKFPRPISAQRVMERKAREFAGGGLRTLIGGYFGNANREKIDKVVHAVLMDLASSPLKYSFEDIAMMYNTMDEYSKLPRMTVSAIKQHLNKSKHKKVWMYLRHGKLAGDSLYQPQALRETPSNPDDLWSIDGTTAQLYYKDGEGRIKSDLYVYFVTDASTGSVIGNSVAYTETSGLVVEALQDAINTYGYCPKQIQYDNSSANVQDTVKGLMRNMSRVHFPCKPYLGRAKYVEEIIGHFQQRSLRQLKNFKGGNITSTSLNSKANPDLLKWLRANPTELPSENEAIEQVKQAIQNWNSRGERRDNYGVWVGQSKISRYTAVGEDRKKLNYFEKLSLFMVELTKPYKYKQQGICLTVGGVKHNYIVPDPDNSANDFMFSNDNMYKEFIVRINLNNPQYIKLFDKVGRPVAEAVEKEKFAAAVANLKEGGRTKIVDFLQKQVQYGYDYAFSELRQQRQILEQHGLRATGTGDFFGTNYSEKRGDFFGWQDATKSAWNAIESDMQDEQNGMSEPSIRRRTSSRSDIINALNKM